MIIRGPGFRAVVSCSSPIRFPPSSVSKLPFFLRLPVGRHSSLLPGLGGPRGWARSQIIRQRESLAIYISFKTLYCNPVDIILLKDVWFGRTVLLVLKGCFQFGLAGWFQFGLAGWFQFGLAGWFQFGLASCVYLLRCGSRDRETARHCLDQWHTYT
jgi:hypothetical protein